MSRIHKRYLLMGVVFFLIAVGLIIGAIHPYKHALGSQPLPTPVVEVVQVQQEDVPIMGNGSAPRWVGEC